MCARVVRACVRACVCASVRVRVCVVCVCVCFQARSPLAQEAHRKFPFKLVPHLIGRCKYNYQRESQQAETCPTGFDCRTDTVTVHKPHYLSGGKRVPQNKEKWAGQNQWPKDMSYRADKHRQSVCGCGTDTGAPYGSGWKNLPCSPETWRHMPGVEKGNKTRQGGSGVPAI